MHITSAYSDTLREEMVDFITNKPTTSLEVGCRAGNFSKLIKQQLKIKECWGVEPDDTISETAKMNLDTFIPDYFSAKLELPRWYFDLIIFNDVLEHLYDPWETLEFCRELLSPNGRIIASIPNIRQTAVLKELLFNDTFRYTQAGVMDITHIRFFTQKTMRELFTSCGYEIEVIKPLNRKNKRKSKRKILFKSCYRTMFNIISFYQFESIFIKQFGLTARIKK